MTDKNQDDYCRLEFLNEKNKCQGMVHLINNDDGSYSIKYQEYTIGQRVYFNLKRWLKRRNGKEE